MRFEDALRIAGLKPRDIVADGRLRRCPTESHPGKRNGWHVLHADGTGHWGDWASGSGAALGHWKDEQAATRAPDPQAQERMRRKREQDRADRISAIRRARSLWEHARPLSRLHPYIDAKGLTPLGCAGLRQHDGLLVVPILYAGRICSVQTISPSGEKKFPWLAPTKAGSYVIDRPRAALTAIVEGLATGLAVYQAVRHARVIVAFNAGNLLPVVQHLKPRGSVVLAADNDHGTMKRRGFNPGLDHARNAAELLGCGVTWPEGIEGTDFADMLSEIGEGAHRRVERQILSAARYVATPA